MGYSIAAHARNKTLLKKMISFMEKNYTLPHKLFRPGSEEVADYSRPTHNCGTKEWVRQHGLSYDRNPLAIGFDYSACEPERDYIFEVCYWMVLKIGVTGEYEGRKAPMFFYDGGHCKDDRWPVLVRSKWEKIVGKRDWHLTDEVGFRPIHLKHCEGTPAYDDLKNEKQRREFINGRMKYYSQLVGVDWRKVNQIIHGELKRLDKMWEMGQ